MDCLLLLIMVLNPGQYKDIKYTIYISDWSKK